jgi:hypothetical protein
MASNKNTDIETQTLLDSIKNPNSNRTSTIGGLRERGLENAEALRASLLESFKSTHEICIRTQKRDSHSFSKSILGIFGNTSKSSTLIQAEQMQEALAYLHRELTNLITGFKDDAGRYRVKNEGSETLFNEKVNKVIDEGLKKMPEGKLLIHLKNQLEDFKRSQLPKPPPPLSSSRKT